MGPGATTPIAFVQASGGAVALRRLGASVHGALGETLGTASLVIGIGGAFTDANDSRRSCREAEDAIGIGAIVCPEERVVLYEDVLVAAALSADKELLARLASILDPIAQGDGRGRGPLLTTLQAFFDADLSARAAAGRLNIHRHTLDYRLHRIERLLGRPVRRGADRLLLETALLARRVRHSRLSGAGR